MTLAGSTREPLWDLMGLLFRAHPWHGVSPGDHAPDELTCYIEVVPTDSVKYEIDKTSGLLKLDRPQKFSNVCPTMYGLVPRTYCGDRVAALSAERTGRPGVQGDADPLDICVLSERPITHGDILVKARPIGGLRMLDGAEADDKIIAVLVGDAAYGHVRELADSPRPLVDRLIHYFETYKLAPGADDRPCEITHIYGRDEAHDVIRRAQDDYRERFGGLTSLLDAALKG
jgi:inorganic pyrophosphatase